MVPSLLHNETSQWNLTMNCHGINPLHKSNRKSHKKKMLNKCTTRTTSMCKCIRNNAYKRKLLRKNVGKNASRNKCTKRKNIFWRKSSNKSANVNNGDMQWNMSQCSNKMLHNWSLYNQGSLLTLQIIERLTLQK
jgi:hypothetical protein